MLRFWADLSHRVIVSLYIDPCSVIVVLQEEIAAALKAVAEGTHLPEPQDAAFHAAVGSRHSAPHDESAAPHEVQPGAASMRSGREPKPCPAAAGRQLSRAADHHPTQSDSPSLSHHSHTSLYQESDKPVMPLPSVVRSPSLQHQRRASTPSRSSGPARCRQPLGQAPAAFPPAARSRSAGANAAFGYDEDHHGMYVANHRQARLPLLPHGYTPEQQHQLHQQMQLLAHGHVHGARGMMDHHPHMVAPGTPPHEHLSATPPHVRGIVRNEAVTADHPMRPRMQSPQLDLQQTLPLLLALLASGNGAHAAALGLDGVDLEGLIHQLGGTVPHPGGRGTAPHVVGADMAHHAQMDVSHHQAPRQSLHHQAAGQSEFDDDELFNIMNAPRAKRTMSSSSGHIRRESSGGVNGSTLHSTADHKIKKQPGHPAHATHQRNTAAMIKSDLGGQANGFGLHAKQEVRLSRFGRHSQGVSHKHLPHDDPAQSWFGQQQVGSFEPHPMQVGRQGSGCLGASVKLPRSVSDTGIPPQRVDRFQAAASSLRQPIQAAHPMMADYQPMEPVSSNAAYKEDGQILFKRMNDSAHIASHPRQPRHVQGLTSSPSGPHTPGPEQDTAAGNPAELGSDEDGSVMGPRLDALATIAAMMCDGDLTDDEQ